jgi:hypothetical protein
MLRAIPIKNEFRKENVQYENYPCFVFFSEMTTQARKNSQGMEPKTATANSRDDHDDHRDHHDHCRKEYDQLKTSTKTVMVYTNLTFDLANMFRCFPTCPVRIAKKKKAKVKDIWGPYGGLISIQNGKETRGVNTRKNSLGCWPTARTVQEPALSGEEPLLPGEDRMVYDPHLDLSLKFSEDASEWQVEISECGPSVSEPRTIDHFLNQISILMSMTNLPNQTPPNLTCTRSKFGSVEYVTHNIECAFEYHRDVNCEDQKLVFTPNITRDNYNIHIMLFNSNIKMAGCKSDQDAILAINILYEWYLKPLSMTHHAFDIHESPVRVPIQTAMQSVEQANFQEASDPEQLQPTDGPIFVFDTVMKNVDFSLGFDVDRELVNNLFNQKHDFQSGVVKKSNSTFSEWRDSDVSEFVSRSPKDNETQTHANDIGVGLEERDSGLPIIHEALHKVFLSQFEPTEQKSVNLKMLAKKPQNFRWTCYRPEHDVKISDTDNLQHKENPAQLYTSFLIFSSGKIILSGKYDEDMADSYNKIVSILTQNRHRIEEKINVVTQAEKREFWDLLGAKPRLEPKFADWNSVTYELSDGCGMMFLTPPTTSCFFV